MSKTAAFFQGLFLLILALTGISLAWLGAQLMMLGGSPYYLPAGIGMIAAAVLIARRRPAGIWLYTVFLAATWIWAFWESGVDGWALAPRLAMPTFMGLWLLTPWARAAVGLDRRWRGARLFWPGLALLVVGSVAFLFWFDQPQTASATVMTASSPTSPEQGDWPNYGNDPGGSRYSPLAQITLSNVAALQPAWVYHTGPTPVGAKASFQATPIKIGERVYLCTGYNDVIALDAETGHEVWRHRSHVNSDGVFGLSCRGVTYYRVPNAKGFCAERIYTAAIDARLIALDAQTGAACPGFGTKGEVNLLAGMGPVEKGYYFVTSAPQLMRGKLVLGGWVIDGQETGEPSGVVRAFDAVTGDFAWAFDIGKPDVHGLPPQGQAFTRGTPNSWAPISADEALGLVYIPTGNATPDYYGAHRTANDDRFASSVIALDANSGAVRWAFQTTHHDLWDYDVPAQPTLVDLPNGVKGLLQPTKRGEIFFLDRRTGLPIAKVEERPVPQGGVPGERLAATQPFSTGLPSFGGRRPSEKGMWGLTPIDQAMCRIKFREARFEGTMTPLGVDRPTLTWPGYLGGIDWGGVSVDPVRHLMFVNSNGVANYNRLIPRAVANRMGLHPMTAAHMSDVGGPAAQMGVPYAAAIRPFLSPIFIPCQQPPYGMISAVDLTTGKKVWTRRFGTSRDSGPLALPTFLPIPMGMPNLGGSVMTASGLTFIGATQEHVLRAYASTTGAELWKARLPAGAQATPATYWSARSGRQFVVVAAGGHGAMLSGSSDTLIAYALPESNPEKKR
jgi:quinoprotein glucose dehydrogenase